MGKIFKKAFKQLKKCWRILFTMEIFYKGFASIAVFPFCKWLFSESLQFTGIYYFSTANIVDVLANPLNDLCILVIFFILAIYMVFEVSFLITCFHQASYDQEIGILQLIKESFVQSLRVLKPKNWYLLLFLMLIIPFTDVFSLSNLINKITIPWFIAENTIAVYPWNIVSAVVTVLLAIFIFPRLLVFHYFFIDHEDSAKAFKSSIALFKGKRIKAFLFLSLFYFVLILSTTLFWLLLDSLGTLAINYITSGALQNYLQISFIKTLEDIFTFALNCLSVFATYAFLNSFYQTIRTYLKQPIPQPLKPKSVHAKRHNRLIFYPILIVIIVFSLFANTLMTASVKSAYKDYGIDAFKSSTLVIGHRGNAVLAPENTLPAFEKAIELGADYVELDVQESKDGVIVVTHDSNFSRTCGYDGNVWEMDYADIAKLDAGKKFNESFTGTKVPTLDEVIKLCKGKVKLLIELKTNGHEVDLAGRTLKVVEDNDALDQIMIHSLSYKQLEDVKAIAPKVNCGYIMTIALGNYEKLPDADFFTIETTTVTSDYVDSIHKAGKFIFAWTVDTDDDIEKVLNAQVDGIITNDVSAVKNAIDDKQNNFLETYKYFLQ